MGKEGFGQLLGALIRERREAAGMTQRDLAEESFPDQADHEGKERRIRELELGEVTRPQARNYTPICETLNIDRAIIRALKTQAADAKAQNEAEFNEVIEDRGSVEAALSDASLLNRSELERLAERFGIDAPETQPDAALAQLLSLKAEEYRALKAEVEAIGETYQRLSNMKAAARDAIARGDLEEVEELLGRVQEVELEEAAKTAELRAQNALLRGNVEQAYRLLSAAADSFAAVDRSEPIRRCTHEYSEQLIRHGMRYGGLGLRLGAKMADRLLTREIEDEIPLLFAAGKNHLAVALRYQGTRAAGEAGAVLLAEAVEAYRAALRVRTEAAHPVDWATTMTNLGGALATQGTRTEGEAGAALLAEAVEAYRAALRVCTEAARPVDWAAIMQNLAIALRTQGSRAYGDSCAKVLGEAVEAYRAALRVFTEKAYPVEWAVTMQNLGFALGTQGCRAKGEVGAKQLNEALEAHRAALRVRSEETHPVQWATTQQNMAIAEKALAKHDTTADPRPHLEAAMAHVENALRVYDPEHMGFYHESATKVRNEIQAALDSLDSA